MAGLIMKNGVAYSGGGSGTEIPEITQAEYDALTDKSGLYLITDADSAMADTEVRIREIINDELKSMFYRVDLGKVDYTIPANDCVDVYIPYNDKIPAGYTPIAIYDYDLNLGGKGYIPIKRAHPYFDDTQACIGLSNNTFSEVSGKLWIRVLCIKKSMLNYIYAE